MTRLFSVLAPQRGAREEFRWANRLACVTLVAAVLLDGASAQAQIGGLAEQAAVSDIQGELAGGRGNRNNNAQDPRDGQGPVDDAEASDGEPEAESGGSAEFARDKWNDQHSILRLEIPAVSLLKVLSLVVVFLGWVRTADWVNKDAQIFDLGYQLWNLVVVAPFVLASLVALMVPNYFVGIALTTLAWAIPSLVYVAHHNKSVEKHQTVLTGSWWRFQLARALRPLGVKMSTEKKAGYLRGPDVDLHARGGDDRVDHANLLTARQSPGYVHVKELIADMVARGSSRVLMEYSAEVVSIRHLIDGVWHNGEARDRESGDVMLAVMKRLSNLNESERQQKQQGEFGAEYEGVKYDCELGSKGTRSGEQVVVAIKGETLKAGMLTLEALGMREKLREQWLEIMRSDQGLVVISALPEGGLTTLTDVSLTETDRLLRDFVTIEETNDRQTDIENIEAHYFDAAQGESPARLVPTLSRKYPNVWVVRDFVDAETAKLMMEEVELDRLVITNVQAKDAAEACLRLLKKKTPHKEFARGVTAVLCTRLIRKLCPACQVEYEATPAMLKKLGIPSGKVTRLFRPPKDEEIDKPCKVCDGIGYKGRTGLFELLVVDDAFRAALLKQPQLDTLRKTARAGGMRTFQEEGILLVAKGLTSLQELSRVLKE